MQSAIRNPQSAIDFAVVHVSADRHSEHPDAAGVAAGGEFLEEFSLLGFVAAVEQELEAVGDSYWSPGRNCNCSALEGCSTPHGWFDRGHLNAEERRSVIRRMRRFSQIPNAFNLRKSAQSADQTHGPVCCRVRGFEESFSPQMGHRWTQMQKERAVVGSLAFVLILSLSVCICAPSLANSSSRFPPANPAGPTRRS